MSEGRGQVRVGRLRWVMAVWVLVVVALVGSAGASSPGTVVEVDGAVYVGTYPYAPAPIDGGYAQPNWCGLRYHEYRPTTGCGGATLSLTLNVGFDYRDHLDPNTGETTTYFGFAHAEARLRRTFGCVDEATGKVRKTVSIAERRPLSSVYYSAVFSPSAAEGFGADPATGEFNPRFYVNFDVLNGANGLDGARVAVYCQPEEYPKHLTTTMSQVRVVIDDLTSTVRPPAPGSDPVITTLPSIRFRIDGRWTTDSAVWVE